MTRGADGFESSRGRVRRFLLAPVVVVAIIGGLAACQPPRPIDKSKPVLFVHGYNFSPAQTDCGATFDNSISQLRAQGFTGPMIKVGYYEADTNCDVNLHDFRGYDDRDSWREIAKAFSAYVQTTFTTKGITIDAVGYSMGALIVRGGIWGTQKGESGFGAPIDIEDFVSLGGPHTGAAWYTRLCLWGQCSSLKPGSGDLNWLNENGNPQGSKTTESTVIGSSTDDTVPLESAVYMAVLPSNRVEYNDIEHSGSNNYNNNAKVVARTGAGLAGPNQ